MTKAKIFNSPDKCIFCLELIRVRDLTGLSQEEVANRMRKLGWRYCREKITLFENPKQKKVIYCKDTKKKEAYFCLHPVEMQALLDALGATSL